MLLGYLLSRDKRMSNSPMTKTSIHHAAEEEEEEVNAMRGTSWWILVAERCANDVRDVRIRCVIEGR